MISNEERRLLGRISRHVFGHINAWTTLNDDAETERLVQSLISQGLVEAYGEKGVRMTQDGLDALDTAAAPPPLPRQESQDLEQQEAEERHRRRASLSDAELEHLQGIEASVMERDSNARTPTEGTASS